MCVLKESNMWGGYRKIAGVKNNRILVEKFDKINLPLLFVKLFGLTSGTSVRGTVGLVLVEKGFNCLNFYSLDL